MKCAGFLVFTYPKLCHVTWRPTILLRCLGEQQSAVVWLARPSHLIAGALKWDGLASQTTLHGDRCSDMYETTSLQKASHR